MAKKSKSKKSKLSPKKILRFAHPFFTPVPMDKRTAVPGVGNRIGDYVQTNLLPVPSPQRDQPMTLDDLIGPEGTKQIQTAGSITFHTVGDTGHENGLMQELVAAAMSADYDPAHPEISPAFLPSSRGRHLLRQHG